MILDKKTFANPKRPEENAILSLSAQSKPNLGS
jgi:hypothetical protein